MEENKTKKELWEYFFSKPKKNDNKYMFEMVNYPDYLLYDDEQIDALKNKWNVMFKNDNDIYLEIGCGSGNFTVGNANKFKNRNYIGVELRLKRLVMCAKKSEKRELKNIIFIRKRAEKVLDFLGENEINGVYINFPDPWEKEIKNRVFSDELLNKLNIVMKKNSKIFFKTDHMQYYEDILELINSRDDYKVLYNTADLYSTEKVQENIQTEFEQLFLSKHKMQIKYIEIEKLT